MDYTEEKYRPVLLKLSKDIDGMDYFQILNLPISCNKADIKRQYYNLSRALHPDKFFQLGDEPLKQAVKKIYKRVTESYTVLRDDKKRPAYLKQISGSERKQHLRFSEQDEQSMTQQNRSQATVAQTPQGQKCYAAYLTEMGKKNLDAAWRHLQSAMIFETGNPKLLELKSELEALRKAAAEGEGSP